MARAPVGTSSAKAALLTVDQVLQVKGGLPWSAQTAAALYGWLLCCSERNMLADGNLHTAKKIPKDLVDADKDGTVEVRWDFEKDCWMWSAASAARKTDSDAGKLRNLTVALRQEFERQVFYSYGPKFCGGNTGVLRSSHTHTAAPSSWRSLLPYYQELLWRTSRCAAGQFQPRKPSRYAERGSCRLPAPSAAGGGS